MRAAAGAASRWIQRADDQRSARSEALRRRALPLQFAVFD